MSTWSSGIGKFKKKDPSHGWLGKKISNWWCNVGLCNMDTCTNKEYHQGNIPNNCCNKNCGCHSKKDK